MLRAGAGSRARNARVNLPRASELWLYEFEACPFCRKVRELLTFLDLEATIFPCPKGGTRYRPDAIRRGGKAQFPFLVDRRADCQIYESDAIIAHLASAYGEGQIPVSLRLGPVTSATASAASLVRGAAGTFARPSHPAEQPLVLYGFEACPETRPIREALCVYEVPYVLRNAAPGSRRRGELARLSDGGTAPYLEDPNTGEARVGAENAAAYVRATYAAASPAAF